MSFRPCVRACLFSGGMSFASVFRRRVVVPKFSFVVSESSSVVPESSFVVPESSFVVPESSLGAR